MFRVDIDMTELASLTELDAIANKEVQKAMEALAHLTQAHIMEEAKKVLHSRLNTFLDALSIIPINDNTWVVNLDQSAVWIDEGRQAKNMIDDLLKGRSSRVIPFQLNKLPQNMTPAQQTLMSTVRAALRTAKVSPTKIDTDSDGRPKEGLVHSMDINTKPIKKAEGPGTGKGPIGKVMQSSVGRPLLAGVRIYQKNTENKDGSKSMKKFIMTFRTVSESQKNEPGRWDYPDLPPTNIFDKGLKFALETWESKIAPELIDTIIAGIS